MRHGHRTVWTWDEINLAALNLLGNAYLLLWVLHGIGSAKSNCYTRGSQCFADAETYRIFSVALLIGGLNHAGLT